MITVLGCALRIVGMLCATGPIMQAFLASLGFPSRFLYIHSTLTQAANLLTICLFSRWADRGSIVKRSALIQVPYALLYLCYIPLCLWQSPSIGSFISLTGICLLQSVFFAVFTVMMLGRTMVDYAVPTALRFVVPVEIAGPYNALRMLLHNGGTLLATTLAAFLPVSWLLILTTALQLLSGLTT